MSAFSMITFNQTSKIHVSLMDCLLFWPSWKHMKDDWYWWTRRQPLENIDHIEWMMYYLGLFWILVKSYFATLVLAHDNDSTMAHCECYSATRHQCSLNGDASWDVS